VTAPLWRYMRRAECPIVPRGTRPVSGHGLRIAYLIPTRTRKLPPVGHCSPVLAACVVSPDERSPSQRGEVGRNKTSGSTAYPAAQAKRDRSMPLKRGQSEGDYGYVSQDPCAMVTATLPKPQPPALQAHGLRTTSDAEPPRWRVKAADASTLHSVGKTFGDKMEEGGGEHA